MWDVMLLGSLGEVADAKVFQHPLTQFSHGDSFRRPWERLLPRPDSVWVRGSPRFPLTPPSGARGEGQGACQSAEDSRKRTPRLDIRPVPRPRPRRGQRRTRSGSQPLGSLHSRRVGVLARVPGYREAVSFNYPCAATSSTLVHPGGVTRGQLATTTTRVYAGPDPATTTRVHRPQSPDFRAATTTPVQSGPLAGAVSVGAGAFPVSPGRQVGCARRMPTASSSTGAPTRTTGAGRAGPGW